MRSGTDVQRKMHQPGLYSSFDLNANAENGSWGSPNLSRNLGQLHDSSQDSEQVRQVMLRHDSVFRQQLHELHRVYRIQTEMMNEFRNKELNGRVFAVNTPESSTVSLRFVDEDKPQKWHTSDSEFLDLNCGRQFSFFADIRSQPLDLKRKELQYGYGSTLDGCKVNHHGTLEFQTRKIQRRLFDLECPATESVNIEEGDWGTISMTGVQSYSQERRYEVSYLRDGSFSNNGGPTRHCIKRTNGFTDLNEPIQVQDRSGSASFDILGKVTKYKDDGERKDQSPRSQLDYQCLAIECHPVSSKAREECISHQTLHLKTEDTQDWLFHNLETGRSRFADGPYPADPCRSTKSLQVGHAIPQRDLFCSSAQSKNQRCVKKIFGVEVPEITHGKSIATSNVLDQPAVSALSGVTNSESFSMNWKSFAPSLNKDLPQTTCSITSTQNIQRGMSYQKGSVFCPASESNAFPVSCSSVGFHSQNGNSCRNFASQELAQCGANNIQMSNSGLEANYAIDLNIGALPAGSYQNGTVSPSNLLPGNSRKMESHRGSSWPEASQLYQDKAVEKVEGFYHKSLASSQNHSQQSVDKPEGQKSPSRGCTRDSLPATCADDTKNQTTEAYGGMNNKIFGFSITETTSKDSLIPKLPSKPNPPTSANGEANSNEIGLLDSELTRYRLPPCLVRSQDRCQVGLVVKKGFENQNADAGHPIDLNLSFTEEGVVEDAEPIPSSPGIKEEIDLEMPVTMESESSTDPACESLESILRESSMSSQCETTDPKDDVLGVSAAAEALVAISTSKAPNLEDMETSASETLCWLAEIATSLTSLDEDGVCDESSVWNEVDYFEFMTLNIKETRAEEVYYNPEFHPHQEGKPLPRRGQARRGKKRKDFQRDVLPNLTSLTRNEVAKDINVIEGLIRASGGNWQSALTRKKNAKAASVKGNIRSGGSTCTMKTISCLNPVQQPKLCSEDRSLVVSGWGKRTRRPPRQRCMLNNPPLLVK